MILKDTYKHTSILMQKLYILVHIRKNQQDKPVKTFLYKQVIYTLMYPISHGQLYKEY